jgi:hypothetical protein
MPAEPRVGNVFRSENAPGIAFEQIRVESVDQLVAGPSGNISGAIKVTELHMDNTTEEKTFAPGYGEFSTGGPGGDLEAVLLASPTDRRQGEAPAEFAVLSKAVDGVYEAAATEDADRLKQAAAGLDTAWEAVRAKGIPPQMESQMRRDIEALSSEAVQSAALRVAQNELDLRLLFQPVIDVDLARLRLWARQLQIDVATEDAGLVLADVAALERVWERTKHGVEPTAPVDTALEELQKASENMAPVESAVAAVFSAVGGLHTR